MPINLIDTHELAAAGVDSDLWVEACLDCGSPETSGHAHCPRCAD